MKLYGFAVAITLLATACTPQAVTSPGFGHSQAVNEHAQLVTPAPHPSPEAAPDQDGKRADAAWQRYRNGKVIRPTQLNTSDIPAPAASGSGQ
jgi:hypothetical protein